MMFDLSSKIETFYKLFVVLSREKQAELYDKKELNIKRLNEGLADYNDEHNTNYSIMETQIQGSVAMATVVQNEDNDYDIDVAIVFDKDVLGDKGARATRNIVANALKRKTKQFNAEPEVKTSCVRVKYQDGYHIDFAIYRKCWDEQTSKWKYEHAGLDWQERELTGLTDWFKKQNNESGGKLRKIVRLSKMFCDSRDLWVNMPSGLLQTVLCDEKLDTKYERIDELFYYTMKAIVERLNSDTSVQAPVDNGRDLTPRDIDIQKMINWKNRLKSKLEDLDVLFKDDCTQNDALQAWYGFFNSDYWNSFDTEDASREIASVQKSEVVSFDETEQFIEEMFEVNDIYSVDVSCNISGDGFRCKPMKDFLTILRRYVPHDFSIICKVISTTVPFPYDIYWKVKNVGPMAERKNMLRGQIVNRGISITEHTCFYGNHYIECYIVKDGVCMARKRINVPIGRW